MSLIERAIGKLHAGQVPVGLAQTATGAREQQSQRGSAALDHFTQPHIGITGETVPDSAIEPAAEAAQAPLDISLQRLARQGYIAPGTDPGPTLNEFRMIKRPLVFNVSTRKLPALANAHRIMVTSALPGEGKTFCAINLALSIADERDHSVLLVDADVARPTIPATLGIKPQPGLMDALADTTIDVGELVVPTSIDKFSLLMAGRHHGKATEMLASSAMSILLQRLSARFPDRIIIFDSPPLLATTEASVLAVHMGQIVLVVEAGRTDRSAVTAALASLEGAPGMISTLMNKATPRRKSEFLPYGGYGYGYEARA